MIENSDLFAKYLEPLNDWEPFAFCLSGGITQLDAYIIKMKESSYLRMEALHKRWLQVNPQASWRDVINALKKCKENELARTIEDKVTDPTAGESADMEVSANPGLVSGKHTLNTTLTKCYTTAGTTPSSILRMNYAILVDAITNNLYRVTNGLYAKGLIPMETINHIQTAPAISNVVRSGQLMSVLQKQLESSLNPEQYLINICHVLINQQHHTLTDIATSILYLLGECVYIISD